MDAAFSCCCAAQVGENAEDRKMAGDGVSGMGEGVSVVEGCAKRKEAVKWEEEGRSGEVLLLCG